MENRPLYCSFSPLTVLFVTYFFQAFEFFLVVPTFQYLTIRFSEASFLEGLRLGLTSKSLALYYIGLILLNPYMGAFSDSFGKRKTLLLIESLRFVSFMLCAFGYWLPAIAVYFLGRFFDGISSSVSFISLSAIVDLYDSARRRIKAFALIRIVDSLLIAIFFYITTTYPHPSINPIPSPTQIYLIAGCVSLFVFFFLYTNFSETALQVHTWNGPWFHCFHGFGKILREPQVKTLLFLYFLWGYSFCSIMKMSTEAIYFHIGENYLLLALTLFAAVMSAVSYFLLPALLPRYSVKTLLLFSLSILAILCALQPLGISSPYLFLLACSFSIGILLTLYPWLLSQILPQETLGRAFGLKHVLWGLGVLLSYYYTYNPLAFLLLGLLLLARFHPRPEMTYTDQN